MPSELLEYHPGVFDELQSQYLLNKFISEIPWQQKVVKMYDKEVITPRLSTWYADPENYIILRFAGPHPMYGQQNYGLLRDGNDSVA